MVVAFDQAALLEFGKQRRQALPRTASGKIQKHILRGWPQSS
jgi:hypothetical protein